MVILDYIQVGSTPSKYILTRDTQRRDTEKRRSYAAGGRDRS